MQAGETKSRPEAASSGNLLAARDAEALVEAVNTATGSNITLFAGEERVAFAAHVEVQVVTNGGADFHDITARTGSSNFVVIWVNTFFMGEPQLRPRRSSSPNARHHAILVISVAFYAADSVKHAVMVNLQCDIKRIKGGESYRI